MSRVILKDGRTINVSHAELVEIDAKVKDSKKKTTREEVAADMFPAPKLTKAEKAEAAAVAEEPAPSATGKRS